MRVFGEPSVTNCVSSHLTYQRMDIGSGVHELVTKPNKNDYTAFEKLTKLEEIEFRRHICSPVGCSGDKIELGLFFNIIVKVLKKPDAVVSIISYSHKSLKPTSKKRS